ncbi:MAG: NAD(P)/FAD-dependent oxidoreductase [Candidatus Micrarchaeota archaeon]
MYDIIIVGAGPAGSMAAKTAAKMGANVIMIERRKEVGAPVRCGEGIGQHWMDEFQMEMNPKAISAHINGAVLVSPNLKHEVKIRNNETKGYVVDRKIFDKDLALDAGRAGAEIMIKSEVIDVIKKNGKVAGVKVDSEGEKIELEGKVVIAADGGESTVARMAGINAAATLYDTDFGIEYEMVNVPCSDLIEIYFGREWAPRGYVWVFPKGKDVANVGVGIGGLEKGHAIDYLKKFLKLERFKNAQPVAVKAGLIPVGEPLKQLVADGLIVAGTSAHQVDPIHGGGICLAMDAGVIAGEVAADAVKSGDVSAAKLGDYDKKWRAKNERKLLKRLMLRKVLEKLNDDDLNVVFSKLDDKAIDALLKGEYAGVVKDVLVARPQLLKALSVLVE